MPLSMGFILFSCVFTSERSNGHSRRRFKVAEASSGTHSGSEYLACEDEEARGAVEQRLASGGAALQRSRSVPRLHSYRGRCPPEGARPAVPMTTPLFPGPRSQEVGEKAGLAECVACARHRTGSRAEVGGARTLTPPEAAGQPGVGAGRTGPGSGFRALGQVHRGSLPPTGLEPRRRFRLGSWGEGSVWRRGL